MPRQFNFHYNLIRITGTLHKDQHTFLSISRSVPLRTRNFSDKSCTENQNTHFKFNNLFFANFAVYEIVWKNIVQPDMPQITIRHMRIASWITKATDTHSEHVIIIAFPLQKKKMVRKGLNGTVYTHTV